MSEKSAVQDPMLKYAAEIGWHIVKPDEALVLRGGVEGQFFSHLLMERLLAPNPGVLDAERTAEVVRRLLHLPATVEGKRVTCTALRKVRLRKIVDP